MKIEELIKDLDPVTIIEFKNYVIENLMSSVKLKIQILKLFLIIDVMK